MRKYYIIGSGGFAKEVLFLSLQSLGDNHEFCGFIEHNANRKIFNCMNIDYPVHDEANFLKEILPQDNIDLYIGIGNPKLIASVYSKFKDYNFPNLIHPNFVGHLSSIQMGKGNIITAGCVFTVDIEIGHLNIFNLNTTVGHDAEIGNFNVFNPGCNVSGSVKIGDCNLFGTNSTILQGVGFGNYSTLGAGSLCNKEVGDNLIMVGVPAKPLQK